MTIAYFLMFAFQPGLQQNTLKGIRMYVVTGVPWYGDPACLEWMLILSMAAASANMQPTVVLNAF
jgi:hypothetical protein